MREEVEAAEFGNGREKASVAAGQVLESPF